MQVFKRKGAEGCGEKQAGGRDDGWMDGMCAVAYTLLGRRVGKLDMLKLNRFVMTTLASNNTVFLPTRHVQNILII